MHVIKTPLYQVQQIRELERLAIAQFSVSGETMMQRAGKAAFDFMMHRWPQAKEIAVFCGGGNNGGDGYVVAKLANDWGLKPKIWQVGSRERSSAEATQAFEACEKAGIPMAHFSEITHSATMPDVLIDAILGIGIKDDVSDEVATAIQVMESYKTPILSMDIPSGINADTGQAMGRAVHASVTITFIGLKVGLLTGNAPGYTGQLVINDLQLPSELFLLAVPIAEKITFETYAEYLKPRLRDWHKGLSGHVLVIGGAPGFSGAARMAAQAALRVGAGLVSIATHPEHAMMMNIACPEIMCHGISSVDELTPLFDKANIIALGPGLGRSDWAQDLWKVAIQAKKPLVVDADGLNILAAHPMTNAHWVLTPHPGEAARLLGESTANVQENRLQAIERLQSQYKGVCVLKGAGSLILAPDSLPALCDKGNPGMATAGMGDILTGVIAGLLAQGIPLGEAAKLGVYIHAVAGDFAAREGGERGLMATDLLPYIRNLVNREL